MTIVRSTQGLPMTRQKITPGDTATAISKATYWTVGDRKLPFNSGGTHVVLPGDLLTGATSAATLRVAAIVLESGSWAGGDASGWIYGTNQTGTFEAENLNEGANNNVCTIPSDSSKIFKGMQARSADIVVEDNAIRYSKDGSTPTATSGTRLGTLMSGNQNRSLNDINEIRNFKCIDETSGSAAVVVVECYF